ncbi:hypothetical protein C8R47DRAFT_1315731 [Mycena vitilis]|nr:hypothetical protein C8R47DRAFT_1315731 [Mycena vitilis]
MDLALTKPNDAPENRLLPIMPEDLVVQGGRAQVGFERAVGLGGVPLVILLRVSIDAKCSYGHRYDLSSPRGSAIWEVYRIVWLRPRPTFALLAPPDPPIRGGKNRDFFLYCGGVVVRGARRGTEVHWTAGAHLSLVHFAALGTPGVPGVGRAVQLDSDYSGSIVPAVEPNFSSLDFSSEHLSIDLMRGLAGSIGLEEEVYYTDAVPKLEQQATGDNLVGDPLRFL